MTTRRMIEVWKGPERPPVALFLSLLSEGWRRVPMMQTSGLWFLHRSAG
jgi:hypothetical protein